MSVILSKTLTPSGDFFLTQIFVKDNGEIEIQDSLPIDTIPSSDLEESFLPKALVGRYFASSQTTLSEINTTGTANESFGSDENRTCGANVRIPLNIHSGTLRSISITAHMYNYQDDYHISGDFALGTSDSYYSSYNWLVENYDTYDNPVNLSNTDIYIPNSYSPDSTITLDITSGVSGLNYSPVWDLDSSLSLTVRPHTLTSNPSGLRLISFGNVNITYYARVPDRPANVVASGGDTLAFISWNAPLDDGGADITQYNLEYYNLTVSTGWNTAVSTTGTTNAYVYDLLNDNDYVFRVNAKNLVGTGLYSSESNTITPEKPKVVTPLTFNDANPTRIRIRRDTAANWTGVNPILALGEPGYETDTRYLKIGDNTSEWNDLDYLTTPTGTLTFPAAPDVGLTIGDSAINEDNPKINLNLSNNEKLNLVGGRGIDLTYSQSYNAVSFDLDEVFSPFTTGTLHSPSTRGRAGNVYYDEKHVYMCVALNSWKRIPLSKYKWFAADNIDISDNSGLYPSVTDIYFSGSNMIIVSDGDPYPAKAGTTLVNDGTTSRATFFNNYELTDQSYDFVFAYRGGSNTSSPQIASTGFNGVFTNGVLVDSPSAGDQAIGTFAAPTGGFHYNKVFFDSFFKLDDCGGYLNVDRRYGYNHGKFLTRCWDSSKVYNANSYYSGTNFNGDYYRNTDGHSKIVGFCFDGYPIYGPFGYTDSEDSSGGISLMTSSYVAKETDDHRPTGWKYTNAITVNDINYNLTAGAFIEDFEYRETSGILDQYNGRYAVTPEYPEGTYAYYMTFSSSGLVSPQYPYIIGNYSKQLKVQQSLQSSITPLTVDGYYPLFLTASAAENYGLLNGGDGTYHTHTINDQLYYMPNGVSFVHPSAPTDILLSENRVSEKATVGAIIGTLSSTDSNPADTHTYSLVAGSNDTDNDNFAIINNELRVDSILSYSVQNTHNIRIRSTDQTNRFYEKAFSISVLEGATFTSLSIASGISSILASGNHTFGSTVVGTATDLTYSWSNIGSPYASGISANTGTFYTIGTTNVQSRNDENVNVYLTVKSISAFNTLSASSSFILDHSEDPICTGGYYPLYSSENDAIRDPLGDGTAHMHTVLGVVYWMPNDLPEDYHGEFDCSSLTPSKTQVCLDGSIDVTIANTGDGNRYVFDSNSSNTHRFKATTGTYVFNNVPSSHPIALHNNGKPIAYSGTTLAGNKAGLDGNNYDFYYGTVSGVISGNFGTTSYECYYHGYMGGQDNLIYDNSCTSPTPTLTDASIQSLSSVTGGSSLTLTATKTGTATDVTYSWSISSATGATLSSSTGQTVNLNTTDLDQDEDQTVTITLTASSVSADNSVTTTKTITIVQSSDSSAPTLTGVTITSDTTVNGGVSVAMTATPTGTATDVTYSWSVTSATGVSLSTTTGSNVNLNTTDLDTDTDQSVTVTVTASSVSAASSVSDTQTITIYQSADGGGGYG